MSFVQNYIGLEARIEAVVRRLLADFDIDLSNYPTFDEMNQAIAEAIAGGGGGGGTNNYMLLINKPLESVENESYYGWQMFRATDGKRFALYVGQDGDHCAMMTYDATANRFGIGLVNHPDTITLNDDGTVTIPDMVTRAVVEEMLSKFAETVYTKGEIDGKVEAIDAKISDIDAKVALKADSANVYTKEETYDRKTIDDMIAGGGGGGTTDYNQLSNRPIIDDSVVSRTLLVGDRDGTLLSPLYVAVGGSGDGVASATSRDGVTWEAGGSLINGLWNHSAYGNGVFVVVGRAADGSCACVTSSDGVEWTKQTGLDIKNQWTGVAFGNGIFVAVADETGSSGEHRIAYSSDGISWTGVTGTTYNMSSIIFTSSRFIAVDDKQGRMMMSTDGVTWTMIFTWDDAHKTKRVAYCRPFIIAVGTAFNWGGNTRAITSNDTDKLGERYNGLWEGVGNDEKGANGWLSNGRVFVSCNESTRTTIHTTADGRTWNEITNAPDDTVMATYHLLFTTNCQLSLDDGVTWTAGFEPLDGVTTCCYRGQSWPSSKGVNLVCDDDGVGHVVVNGVDIDPNPIISYNDLIDRPIVDGKLQYSIDGTD